MATKHRSPHIVQAPRGMTFPGAVACVALRSGLYADDVQPRLYHERLIGWSACGWFARYGRPYKLWEAEGEHSYDLWKLLLSKARLRAPLWVASTRMLRDATLLGLWAHAETGHARVGQGCIIGNPPTIIPVFTPAQIVLLDSRNWSPWQPPRDMTTRERAYALVELMHGMQDALLVNGLGSLRMTAGAQALWTWRYACLQHSVVCHTDACASALEREAYMGGRCEPMRLGTLPPDTHEMDIRSAYASVCLNRDVPCLLERVTGSISVDALRWLLDKGEVIADVTLSTSEPAYPVRLRGRVVWPVGQFRTVLHSPELRDACTLRRVRKVHSAASYRGYPALSRYVECVYPLRNDFERRGHKALAGWAKSLLVSLPGALGRSDRQWRHCPWYQTDKAWEQRIIKRGGGRCQVVRTLAGRTEYEYNGGWAWNAVPAIAGWVTSAARMRLLEEVRRAGWDEVQYVDTDCLLTTRRGAERLCPTHPLQSPGLGALVLVGAHKDAWVGGAKHLILSGKVKMGGVYRLPEDQGPTPLDYYVPLHPSGDLQRGHMPEAKSVLRRAGRISGYAGRRLLEDGRMVPLEMNNGEEEQRNG